MVLITRDTAINYSLPSTGNHVGMEVCNRKVFFYLKKLEANFSLPYDNPRFCQINSLTA